jgi:hypothetical protein
VNSKQTPLGGEPASIKPNVPARDAVIPSIISADTPSTNGATVIGVVRFDGSPPTRKKVPYLETDPVCAQMHPTGLLSENVIVNTNATLRNVFVYVQIGLPEIAYAVPTDPVVLDQCGCRYQPHVFGIQTGQVLEIRNSDDTTDNVHSWGFNNDEWNKAQPPGAPPLYRIFAKPEVMLAIKSDIHRWKSGYIGILPHPFFSVTGSDGTYALRRLPPGTFSIVAWHEVYGAQTQQVTVTENELKDFNFTFHAP